MTRKEQARRLARMADIAGNRARAHEMLLADATRAAQAATERHQRIVRMIEATPCVGSVSVLAAAASMRVVLQSAAEMADSKSREERQRRETAMHNLMTAKNRAEQLVSRATEARSVARIEAEYKASLDNGPARPRKLP